jgi:stage II sporulation protein D
MRRLSIALVLALAGALASTASAASVFVVTGHGWGHGVGLSQCGAQGYATKAGWTYDRILAWYYPGTTLGQAPVSTVRVLVADGRSSVTIASDVPFRAISGDGTKVALGPGTATIGPGLRLDAGGKTAQLVDPVRFKPGNGPLTLDRAYRGDLVVHAVGKALQAVNEVPLEQYLYGVLPGEMDPGWASEALKAQAVAARSYALANLRPKGAYDLYADSRSQVYGGVGVENPTTSAAVDATAGRIVLAAGKVATTFFFASSGGRTAAAKDVFSEDLPYLVSVDDPYDSVCQYSNWGPLVFTPRQLTTRLGLTGVRGLRDASESRDGSGRVLRLTLSGATASADLAGTAVRESLELRSTWFDVGVLTLDPVRELLAKSAAPTLTGVVRGLRKVTVQRKTAGVWQDVAKVRPAKDGTFGVRVKGAASGLYRLASGALAGPPIRLRIAAS